MIYNAYLRRGKSHHEEGLELSYLSEGSWPGLEKRAEAINQLRITKEKDNCSNACGIERVRSVFIFGFLR